MRKTVRKEPELFCELEKLCSSKGYAHVIAYFCYRDNVIQHDGELLSDDMHRVPSKEKLTKTEISTLIGLSCKNSISYENISSKLLQEYIDKTEVCLEEIHYSMIPPMEEMLKSKEYSPMSDGRMIRESIFYGGDAAYSFQYRDFSLIKYQEDSLWFQENKGYTIEQAHSVITSILNFQINKISETLASFQTISPKEWTILPAFEFTLNDIYCELALDKTTIQSVLDSFVAPVKLTMESFTALDDFNPMNAYPIIKLEDQKYLLFQQYSLVEALYETPFFWFMNDSKYKNTAMKNRGEFTENFSKERLELVFGKENVFINIDIINETGKKAGEIDVLVVYADRAIILQAKSKKLTIESRKGNDNSLKNDFKKAIQDAYNQGYSCANLLSDTTYTLIDSQKNKLDILRDFKETYIFCVVSDHYPALTFQAREFLTYDTSSTHIMPPFVMDIFMLDIMTEMLQSPLHFLSYINRRTTYGDKLLTSQELIILSYHLKQNLWLDNQYGMMMLDEDLSVDLDIAMLSRRENIPGQKTPIGILTKYKGTPFDKLIKEIDSLGNIGTIDLGFMLLSLGSDTIEQLNYGITKLSKMTLKDDRNHDITMGFEDGRTGLTIHCNNSTLDVATKTLEDHCHRRKYTQKALTWYGICIEPIFCSIKLGINLNFEWENSQEMDEHVKDMTNPKPSDTVELSELFKNAEKKVKRNEKCPCGSGKKYKKCCIA